MERRLVAATAAALFALAGCRMDPTSSGTTGDDASPSARLVSPASAVGVDPSAPLTFAFDHAMMRGMAMDVVLHEGDVRGPAVPAAITWSADRTGVTITPSPALKGGTTYTAEFRCAGMQGGGGMMGMMGGVGAMHGRMSGAGGMTVTISTSERGAQ